MDIGEMWSTLCGQINAHRSESCEDVATITDTVPVTLLTGFLGAGKSTLLVHLLQDPQGLRIRALVNDVGSLSFDPTLVDVEDDIRVELSNGCGCCVTTTEIADSLHALAQEGDCDLIVLEASGASDPTVLAHVIHADEALHLDRIVTVVDAASLMGDRPDHWVEKTLERHIANADCIVVSGCDSLSDSEYEAALQKAAELAPGRTVSRSELTAPASYVLAPSFHRGAYPSVGFSESQHVEMCVRTVNQDFSLTQDEFIHLVENSRPGLVRAKGRLLLDGKYVLVQITPHSLDIRPTNEGPTSITLMSKNIEDIEEISQFVTQVVA